MNKFFTLISVFSIALSANAQIYMQDAFGSTGLTENNAWTTFTTDSGYDWFTDDAGSTGNFYAKMSNYDGTNHAVTAWLITPAIDISGATQPMLSFDNAWNFTGDALEVHVSTDYPGSGDPSSNGTWTDLTGSATWSAGSFSWTASGDIDISSYISANTYIAFKYTGTNSDGSTWEIDDFLVQEGATVTPTVSLYDIQYTTTPPYDSPYMGQEVMTYGIVNGIIQNGPDAGAYFIQDGTGAWNGLYIYDTDAVVAIGDSVELTGIVDEFNGVTELKNISAYTVINSGNTVYAPTTVTSMAANNEEWEGVLMTVMAGECTNNSEGFGLWSIDDGSGVIKGDDDIFAYHLTAVVGSYYDVTGIGHYSFGEAKILPRDILDINQVGWNSVEENENENSIYPNPSTDIVYINAGPNANVQIYSVTGAIVFEGVSPESLDVSELENGVYTVIITENGTRSAQKLIVK